MKFAGDLNLAGYAVFFKPVPGYQPGMKAGTAGDDLYCPDRVKNFFCLAAKTGLQYPGAGYPAFQRVGDRFSLFVNFF